jgi:leucyl-tRNA synthetase
VWEYSHAWADLRSVAGAEGDVADAKADHEHTVRGAGWAGDGEPIRDTTEHLRQRLGKWCETAVEKITEDMESLEMHSAVRNVMRLFDRIRDFEKRVIARQGELSRLDVDALIDALTLLSQLLGPLAPHLAEELWIALGHDEHTAQTPWPGVSFQVPA